MFVVDLNTLVFMYYSSQRRVIYTMYIYIHVYMYVLTISTCSCTGTDRSTYIYAHLR